MLTKLDALGPNLKLGEANDDNDAGADVVDDFDKLENGDEAAAVDKLFRSLANATDSLTGDDTGANLNSPLVFIVMDWSPVSEELVLEAKLVEKLKFMGSSTLNENPENGFAFGALSAVLSDWSSTFGSLEGPDLPGALPLIAEERRPVTFKIFRF